MLVVFIGSYCFSLNNLLTEPNSHIRVQPVTPQGKTSTDYKLTVNGIVVPVEKIEKYSEAPVQYALGEGNEPSKFIDFLATRTGWRESAGRTSINNVSVKNVTVCFDLNAFPSEIEGVSEMYGVNNLTFQGLKLIDSFGKTQLISNQKQLHLKTNSFVYHVRFIK